MGDSSEMPSEDDKSLSDKKFKRTLKTRAQIDALEKFYDEHKYPTESMKLLVAERIGLTEKQISSWFCHRRLKDKRILNGEVHVNGRQDRSSGIIQGIGSGPRQDSCGSTKQSDDGNLGPIEVQSRRVNGQEVLAADLTYEHGVDDNTSSGSSSLPPNMYSNVDSIHMVTSKFSTKSNLNNVKSGKPKSGPSGFLKVKGRVENPAITAVKLQLGSLYRKDGPPLGIEFDHLPPGAFESPIQQHESFYAGEIVPQRSSDATNGDAQYLSKSHHAKARNLSLLKDAPIVHKQPTSSTGYGYTFNQSSHKTVRDGTSLKMSHGPEHSRASFRQMPKQEFSLSNHTAVDMHEDSTQDIPRYDRRNYKERSTMLGDGGFRVSAFSPPQHFQPLGGEADPERAEPWSSHERRRKVGRGDRLRSSYSDMTIEGHGNDTFQDQGLIRKAAKVSNLFAARRKYDSDRDAVQPEIAPKNQMHRANDEYSPYVGKVSWEGVSQQMNQVKRSTAKIPSSSEDDEHEDTTSSED